MHCQFTRSFNKNAVYFFTVITLVIKFLGTAVAADNTHLMSQKRNLHFHGKVYDITVQPRKHVFDFDAERTFLGGEKKLTATYTDLSGKVLSSEAVQFQGDKVVKYNYLGAQTDEKQSLVVDGKTARFQHDSIKSHKSGQEILREPLVAGPAVLDFIWESRGKLNYGEEVRFRYPVIDRLETFGFTLTRKQVIPAGEDYHYVIELKPTSVFVRPFVKAQLFTVDFDNEKIIAIEGRCPILKSENGKLKEFTSRIEIETTSELN